jgi:hypothetical protein
MSQIPINCGYRNKFSVVVRKRNFLIPSIVTWIDFGVFIGGEVAAMHVKVALLPAYIAKRARTFGGDISIHGSRLRGVLDSPTKLSPKGTVGHDRGGRVHFVVGSAPCVLPQFHHHVQHGVQRYQG